MTGRNAGSIADMVYNSIGGMTASVSGNLINLVDMSRIKVQNWTGDAIDSTNIAETYQSVMYEFTRANALAQMANVGLGFNYSLGELSVNKGTGTGDFALLDTAINNANDELKSIGKRNNWAVTV